MFRSKRTGPKSIRTSGDSMSDGSSGELVWHQGRTCDGGACVEVAVAGDTVLVRSSANPDGTPVALSRDEWRTFLAGVKEGIFDRSRAVRRSRWSGPAAARIPLAGPPHPDGITGHATSRAMARSSGAGAAVGGETRVSPP